MAIKRVLTIESIDEPSTRRMLEGIYSSADYKDYEIEHTFFIPKDENKVKKNDLLQTLKSTIKNSCPDAVLVHTGGYFFQNADSFQYAIPKLKKIFPNILFGLQKREIIPKHILKIFDNNDCLIKLENVFFRVNR